MNMHDDTDRFVNALLLIERQVRRIADSMGAPEVPMATDEVGAEQTRDVMAWAAGLGSPPSEWDERLRGMARDD